MEKQKPIFKIIDELCEEKNIKQKMLSFGWIRELEKEDKIHHIIRYQFDLNSAISYKIANDKYATYVILKENKIPMINHEMIFSPFTRTKYFEKSFMYKVKKMLKNASNKIVIKANDSCQGKDVYCVKNKIEAKRIIKKMFKEKKDSISICPYVEIDYEYRVIVLEDQVLYAYKKRKPFIVGDGLQTVKQLINKKYFENDTLILSKNLNLNKILKKDEKLNISWKHNLSNGAEPVIIENDENLEKIKDIAIKAAKAIGIKFATVDIALTSKKEILVVEVNGSVCMNKFAELVPNGYEIAKNIYSKAIDRMFEN